jgi:hypothetical protein
MLVSWPSSASNSRSFRLRGDDRGALAEATDSALDERPSSMGVAERPRAMCGGRVVGGRIDVVFRLSGGPGRGSPDIVTFYVY